MPFDDNRTKKFTNKEFNELERYGDGSIKDLYSIHPLLTIKQVEKLGCDDWSRYNEYVEEIDYEMKMLLEACEC